MENDNNTDEIQIDIPRMVRAVLDKWFLLLLIACIASCFGYVFTRSEQSSSYYSSGKIYVIDREEKEIKVSIEELNVGSKLVEDYKSLITSRLVLENVINRLGLDMTYQKLKSCITVNNPVDTRIIEISVRYDDIKGIRQILNTIEDVTCNELANKLGTEHPTILERACDPEIFYTKNPMKTAVISGIVAAILLAGFIGVMDIVNSKVRYDNEVENGLHVILLTNVPRVPLRRKLFLRNKERCKERKLWTKS